jgi:ABC-type glycerol-3-phosphate transport system permease component
MVARLFLLICFVVLLLPIWFMLTGSLQDSFGIFAMPPRIVPRTATIENYGRLLGAEGVLRWTLNTIFVACSTILLSIFISCTVGYAFAFYDFRFKKALWLALLAGILVPRISLIVPLFVVINRMGLAGTLTAVVLATALQPVGLYLARAYFSTVPRSILESGRIDGANEFQVLARIVAPSSRPIITALALFAGIAALQDYIWQMLVLQKPRRHTLLVGLMRTVMLRGGSSETNLNPIGQALAAGVILLLPLVLIFAVANKYFTSALGGIENA